MSYFIFNGVLECGNQYELKGEEAQHILKSRRMRTGDFFLIQDEKGQRFEVFLKKDTWYLNILSDKISKALPNN